MSRNLIDRDVLIATLNREKIKYDADVNYFIMDATTIDAVEVVHGEWIHGREIGKEWNCEYWVTYYEDWQCSNCGIVFEQESKPKYNYCPNCGAKMDGRRQNDDKSRTV